MSKSAQVFVFFVVVVPFVALGLAVWLWLSRGLDSFYLWLFLGRYLATGFGITVGFHRLFTHRSFETTKVIRFLLAVLGSMSVQGPIIQWVAAHRRHHEHSDKEGDPHSPNLHAKGLWGFLGGLWHAHTGWLFTFPAQKYQRYANDLVKDRMINRISRLFPLWVVLGLVIPAAIGGLVSSTWQGVGLGFLWGGLVGVFFVHHVTWSVNSVCHLWGTRPHETTDKSRNNPIFAPLAWGEGAHNTHHAFPQSARHGFRWWEFDSSYLIIKLLAYLKLAWDIKLPRQATPPN
ncbi:acyl-CoA desaturase [Candidatus Nomurabacteria bacterium]|nr:acyl-CoA desaturase [Candidatus Nomurabacteria bacterium]